MTDSQIIMAISGVSAFAFLLWVVDDLRTERESVSLVMMFFGGALVQVTALLLALLDVRSEVCELTPIHWCAQEALPLLPRLLIYSLMAWTVALVIYTSCVVWKESKR